MSRPRPICNHHLFFDLLRPESVVLDLGAHRGEFARAVREACGCRVIAVEANPELAAGLAGIDGVETLALAVAEREGEIEIFLADNVLGTSILAAHGETGEQSVTVPVTTLPSLIAGPCGGRLDLLKVNIEGAEIPMLAACDDATLRGIGQITIQFHDFLPELELGPAVAAAKRRLRELGFGEILFKTPNKDVLFVNLAGGALSPVRFHLERLRVRARQYRRAAAKKLALARKRT